MAEPAGTQCQQRETADRDRRRIRSRVDRICRGEPPDGPRRCPGFRSEAVRRHDHVCARAAWADPRLGAPLPPPHISGKGGELASVPLLANGRVGASGAVPGNPESKVSQKYGPRVFDAIRIGVRTVWLIGGGETRGINSFEPRLWACSPRPARPGSSRRRSSRGRGTPTRHSSASTQAGGSGSPGPIPREWSSSILRRSPRALRRASFLVGLRTSSLSCATSPAVLSSTTRGSDCRDLLVDAGRALAHEDRPSNATRAPDHRAEPPRRLLPRRRPHGRLRATGRESQDECIPDPSRARRRARLPRSGCRLDRDSVLDPTCSQQHGAERRVPQREPYATFIPAGLVVVGLFEPTPRSLAVGAFVPLAR